MIRAGTGPVARRTWSRGRRGQSWQTYVRQMCGQGSSAPPGDPWPLPDASVFRSRHGWGP